MFSNNQMTCGGIIILHRVKLLHIQVLWGLFNEKEHPPSRPVVKRPIVYQTVANCQNAVDISRE